MKALDHIVYAVYDLESVMEQLADTLGIAPKFGGYHKTKGTKNALLDLGDQAYLELLALDVGNNEVSLPRWMGIDFICSPKITRWALKSSHLERDAINLKGIAPHLGEIEKGQRTTKDNGLLQWKLTRPLPAPEVELLPFFIEWDTIEAHPTSFLNAGCSLDSFHATHPNPQLIQGRLEKLGVHLEIKESEVIGFHAIIKGPKGSVSL